MKKTILFSLILATTSLLIACSDDDNDSTSTGLLSLNITDAPIYEAEKVVITFSGIEINRANNDKIIINFTAPKQIDLLQLQGVQSESLLNEKPLVAGDYNGIRLMVDEGASYIQISGVQYVLTIPSGSETGLKINRNFTVGAGSTTDFTIDFDLQKSIHLTGSDKYMLRPTLRIVDNLQVSAIRGTVDTALINDITCINNGSNNNIGNVVYLFSGSNITPNDITGSATDAITSAIVKFNADTGNYEYEIGFVPAGNYTVAFSCDGSIDEYDTDDIVIFSSQSNVTVTADQDSNSINLN